MAVQIDWRLLGPPVDVGNAFQTGLRQGQQQRNQGVAQNALAALATNPEDGRAMNALASVEPRTAMQFRDQQYKQQEQVAAQQQDKSKLFAKAAKLAKTPQQWDAIVDHLVANGHPEAAQAKGQFSPDARLAYMAAGGETDESEVKPTNIQRERDYYVSIGRSDLADKLLTNHAIQPRFVTDGAGNVQIVDPSAFVGGGGAAPAAAPPATLTDDEWGDAGGAGSSGPRTFP